MKIVLPLFALILTACSFDANLLNGTWKAVALYEEGQALSDPLDSVVLIFSGDSQYEFRSVGYYREAGPFRAAGKHLFLTDTTENPPKEHALKVLFVSNDTLKIEMRKAGREQVLFLAKRQ